MAISLTEEDFVVKVFDYKMIKSGVLEVIDPQ